MDTLDLQPIATEEVMQRYDIKSRTTLNKFFERAGINSFREGRKTFIKRYELGILDRHAQELNYPINSDTSIQPAQPVQTPVPMPPQGEATDTPALFPFSTVDFLYTTCEYENLPRLAKWTARYAFLERMAAGRVILPRDIVLNILEYKRLPSCKEGYFRYSNFVFFDVNGNKKEWLVSRK